MESRLPALPVRLAPLRDAGLVLAATLFAFLALDDITTDRAAPAGYAPERFALLVCAIVLAVVIINLLRAKKWLLGGLSLVLLMGAAWAQQALSPFSVANRPLEYAITLTAWLWFLALGTFLAVRSFWPRPRMQR